MSEIREGIQGILLRYMGAIHAELIHSHDDIFLTNQIFALLKSKLPDAFDRDDVLLDAMEYKKKLERFFEELGG